jgi:large subunit ribosomal protein L18Ae
MNIRQFLVTGRKLNGENEKENETYAMRVFARNEVFAKSNFWYEMARQNKLKKANG